MHLWLKFQKNSLKNSSVSFKSREHIIPDIARGEIQGTLFSGWEGGAEVVKYETYMVTKIFLKKMQYHHLHIYISVTHNPFLLWNPFFFD